MGSSKATPLTMVFTWEPGINITPPTADANHVALPSSFDELTFDPQGVYDLRRMLGTAPTYRGGYMANQHRFDAADIAWFAAGCSTDGKHTFPHTEFHPIMTRLHLHAAGPDGRRILRERIQSLVFDAVRVFLINKLTVRVCLLFVIHQATLWDRAFGGTTMVIHVDGTRAPGTPLGPEYIKASVYLPPSPVVSEFTDAHQPLADIVQTFIECVGVPTKERWERVCRDYLRWTLKAARSTKDYPSLPRFSTPIPLVGSGSSIFVFHGYSRTPSAPPSLPDPPSLPPPPTSKARKVRKSPATARESSPTQDAAPLKTKKARGRPRKVQKEDSYDTDDMYIDDPATVANSMVADSTVADSTIADSTVPDITFTDIATESECSYEENISSSYLAAFDTTDWALERRSFQEKEEAYLKKITDLEKHVASLQAQLSAVQNAEAPHTTVNAPLLLSPFSPPDRSRTPIRSPASPSQFDDAIAFGISPRPAQSTRVHVSKSVTPSLRENMSKTSTPKGKQSGVLATPSKKRDRPLFFSDLIKVTFIHFLYLCITDKSAA